MATYNQPDIQYSSSATTYNGVTTVSGTASAPLGALVASAVGTTPAPPPTPSYPGGGNPWVRKYKVEQVEQVEKVREPVVVLAVGSARLGGVRVFADGGVVWSILEDEAELLLLI
jgi:hypothetical protein